MQAQRAKQARAKQALTQQPKVVADIMHKAQSDEQAQHAQQLSLTKHSNDAAELKEVVVEELTQQAQHDVEDDLIRSYNPPHAQVCLHASFAGLWVN